MPSLRTTMADLITQVRTLIGDAGATHVFDDQVIQDALDCVRIEQRWIALRPVQSFLPDGTMLFYDYYSDTPNWESDIKLQDMSYNDITANVDLSEDIVGHWHFPTQPNGIGVRATGKTYDVYGASADLLDSWAAQLKLDFDFKSGTDQYTRQQKYQMVTDLAKRYRALARPQRGTLYQSDAALDHAGGGVVYPDVSGTYGN